MSYFSPYQLGMVDIFDPHKADLWGILDTNQQLYVSDAHHTAVIDVNEDGSEGAAACKEVSSLRICNILLPSDACNILMILKWIIISFVSLFIFESALRSTHWKSIPCWSSVCLLHLEQGNWSCCFLRSDYKVRLMQLLIWRC